jgi:hypothetical protein
MNIYLYYSDCVLHAELGGLLHMSVPMPCPIPRAPVMNPSTLLRSAHRQITLQHLKANEYD